MNEIEKTTEAKIQQLQMIEQSLTNLLMQRQQFQSQLIEIESALAELEKTQKVFKIIGNIMVDSKKEDIKKDLIIKKETYDIRIKNLQKQEDNIKEKAKLIQSQVLNEMKPGEKDGGK